MLCSRVLSSGQLKSLPLRVYFVYVFFIFRASEKGHSSVCNLMAEEIRCHCAVFHSLEVDHWIQSTLWERTKLGGELSGVRGPWGPSYGLATTDGENNVVPQILNQEIAWTVLEIVKKTA